MLFRNYDQDPCQQQGRSPSSLLIETVWLEACRTNGRGMEKLQSGASLKACSPGCRLCVNHARSRNSGLFPEVLSCYSIVLKCCCALQFDINTSDRALSHCREDREAGEVCWNFIVRFLRIRKAQIRQHCLSLPIRRVISRKGFNLHASVSGREHDTAMEGTVIRQSRQL